MTKNLETSPTEIDSNLVINMLLSNLNMDTDESIGQKIRNRFYDSWIYSIYQYSWLYNLRWYITHWYKKDHHIITNLSIGYHDRDTLMEDGLFSLVENYVAKDEENGFSNIVFEGEERDKIIEIIHFYRIRQPELQARYDQVLHDCYEGLNLSFIISDEEERSELTFTHGNDFTESQRQDISKYLSALEYQIFTETQLMLHKCIEVRPYLWT